MLPPSSPTEPSSIFSEELASQTASLAATAEPLASPFSGAAADLRSALAVDVDALSPALRELALALHRDPETAFAENRAAGHIADLITASGLDAQVSAFGRSTAVTAEFTAGTGGRTVAFLADQESKAPAVTPDAQPATAP